MKTLMLNQKSGMLLSDIETYVTKTKIYQHKFIIFPSSLYINYMIERGYIVGSQNIAQFNYKNQTGELTGKQLQEVGARYVIIGHSERRINQKEDSNILISKMNEAINNDLNIVYCVGESLVDYKLGNTTQVINNELADVLSNIKLPKNIKLYIAYEPIWAIGSGLTPTVYEIERVADLIREYLKNNNINDCEILYGGSVNNENIDVLLKIDNIDGFLIGGASNDYNKTIEICEKTINSTR